MVRARDYRSDRSLFLDRVVAFLEEDDRFVAAWLGGSFGRGEADDCSDLDVWIIVADNHAESICARHRPSAAGTIEARGDIFERYGQPAVIHEHHANAPAGGSFSSTIYRPNGLAVDWTFVPRSRALRDPDTQLLFDRAGIDIRDEHPTLNHQERTERMAERIAFFWMLAIPAAKAWRRRDGVRFHAILEMMYGARREIECLLEGEATSYTRRSLASFCPTADEQRDALVRLGNAVQSYENDLRAAGMTQPQSATDELRYWLDFELPEAGIVESEK